jgi:hypothetical protein
MYTGDIQNILNCYSISKDCKFEACGTVVTNTATASAPAVEIKMATFTGTERVILQVWGRVCYKIINIWHLDGARGGLWWRTVTPCETFWQQPDIQVADVLPECLNTEKLTIASGISLTRREPCNIWLLVTHTPKDTTSFHKIRGSQRYYTGMFET